MNDCCDRDECIQDDEPWDCACYSHNFPDDPTHEKNPAFRGMTHKYTLEHPELFVWDTEKDCYVTVYYVNSKKETK